MKKLEEKDTDASETKTKKRARKGDAQTWARRYPPSDPRMLDRHNAVKDVFEKKIGHLLKRQSAFQAGCLREGWRHDLGGDLFLGGVLFYRIKDPVAVSSPVQVPLVLGGSLLPALQQSIPGDRLANRDLQGLLQSGRGSCGQISPGEIGPILAIFRTSV